MAAFNRCSGKDKVVMRAPELVTSAIRRLQDSGNHGSIVVALYGHSNAGKSSLAAAVSDTIYVAIVHGYDFYRDMPAGVGSN